MSRHGFYNARLLKFELGAALTCPMYISPPANCPAVICVVSMYSLRKVGVRGLRLLLNKLTVLIGLTAVKVADHANIKTNTIVLLVVQRIIKNVFPWWKLLCLIFITFPSKI